MGLGGLTNTLAPEEDRKNKAGQVMAGFIGGLHSNTTTKSSSVVHGSNNNCGGGNGALLNKNTTIGSTSQDHLDDLTSETKIRIIS